ncbi:hypothetical protein D3C87_1324050 [compost metagenome]
MKKIATLLFFITSFFTSAQQQFFVGKDSDLLTGKSVTVKEGQTSYNGFYKDSGLTKILFKKGIGSDPEKLKGQIFEVKGSMKHPKSYIDDIVLILENKEQGTIYYSYMPKYESTFLLDVVGGLTPPKGFLCSRLSPLKDKFSSKVTIDTPNNFEYSITKIEENGANRIYLRLQSYGTTLNVGKNGLKILFSDGSIMDKPDTKINSKVDTAGYIYSCFINLSKEDIEILSTKTITDYSLYIYERKIKDNNAYELKEYLQCLSK